MATKIIVGQLYHRYQKDPVQPTATIRKIEKTNCKAKKITISDYLPEDKEKWQWIRAITFEELLQMDCKEIWIRRGLYYGSRFYVR